MADGVAPRVTVTLPEALLRLFPAAEEKVVVAAGDIRAVFDALDARWPGMRGRLADTRPAIRRNILVYANGRRASLDTALEDGADVLVTIAMTG